MDELVISGQRYISTKRAGKEHGYHSDYIGQLIRAGKARGQKVGRAWYVNEESLNQYLRAEGTPVAQVDEVPEVVVEEKLEVAPEPEMVQEEKKLEEIKEEVLEEVAVSEPVNVLEEKAEEVVEEMVEETEPEEKIIIKKEEETEEVLEEERPVSRGGLVYIRSDAPLLPEVAQKIYEPAPALTSTLPADVPVRRSRIFMLGVFALIVFLATAGVSRFMVARVSITEGEPAAAYFSLEK